MSTKEKGFLGLGIIILFCFIACTKLDVKQSIPKQDFFNAPTLTDKTVLRVFQGLKERNSKNEFITKFIENKGRPIWNEFLKFDKVSKTAESFQANSSSVQNSSNSNDTIIFIPFVLDNENHVNGFIKAIVNDSIILSYSLAQDYKAYPVTSSNNSPTALEFASLIMLMDNKVFGYTKFEITDKSHLLSNASAYQTNRSIPYELKEVHEDDEPTNLMNSASTCWQSPTIESINGTCTCGGPCWCTRVGCCAVRTCVIILYGGGEGGVGFPSGEAPPTGPYSTGGGGGGQIPHNYPCTTVSTPVPFAASNPNSNNLEENPPPTCPPPGGGIGWIPMTILIQHTEGSEIPHTNPANWDLQNFPSQNLPSWIDFKNNYPMDNIGCELDAPSVYEMAGGPLYNSHLADSDTYGNACALRTSIALTKCGITIPLIQELQTNGTYRNVTKLGANGKYYFITANDLYWWMKQTFGSPPGTYVITRPEATDGEFANKLPVENGIYIMRAMNSSLSTGFGASGHASAFENGNAINCGHLYGSNLDVEGGIRDVTLWKLN